MAGPITQGGTPISRVQHLGSKELFAFLCWGCVGLGPAAATAGAWVPPPQQGVLIANLVEVRTDQTQSGASFELYGEYGLKRGWALVAAPSLSTAVQSSSKEWVLDEVLFAARRKLFLGRSLALSTQIGGFSIPGRRDQSDRAYGVEARFSLGKSFGETGWVNVEGASRSCGAGGIGARFDATLGLKMSNDQRLIVKAFGDGNGCTKAIIRAQVSYVRPFSEKLAVEFGWRQSLEQESASSDRGFVVGLWQKF